jgi:fructose-specific component phosphotransferase system IIB-like protein
LECREELNSYAAETAQELAIIQNKNQAELAIVKDDF